MQVILATRADDSLEEVAEQADRIHEVNHKSVCIASTSQNKPTGTENVEEQIRKLSKQVATLTAKLKEKQSRSHSRSRSFD